MIRPVAAFVLASAMLLGQFGALADEPLVLDWKDNLLTLSGDQVPGGSVDVWYLEAFCRPGATARDWHESVIPHSTQLRRRAPDGSVIELESQLSDGVVVSHRIEATADSVNFLVTAKNPTDRRSQAQWAQPCMRVDRFVGVSPDRTSEAYLKRSFIFLTDDATRKPVLKYMTDIRPWARVARYAPGQVWACRGVSRNDVNPRPLSSLEPALNLIGSVSGNGKKILAMAWEPCQELFQGVIVCLHADFRLGGLDPGETRTIRGRIYLLDNDPEKLLKRHAVDFPESVRNDSARIGTNP